MKKYTLHKNEDFEIKKKVFFILFDIVLLATFFLSYEL